MILCNLILSNSISRKELRVKITRWLSTIFLQNLNLLADIFHKGVALLPKGKKKNICILKYRGFPDSSVGKKSTCNVGHPNLIPGFGRSSGEGIGYPQQYCGLENSQSQ